MTGHPFEPIVVDTSVFSHFLSRDPRGDDYHAVIADHRPFLSFQTVEELWFGALRAGWGPRRIENLKTHLRRYEVFPSTPELILTTAQLRRDCESAGRALDTADAWIAATAVLLDCPLASNDRGFAAVPGLRLLRVSP